MNKYKLKSIFSIFIMFLLSFLIISCNNTTNSKYNYEFLKSKVDNVWSTYINIANEVGNTKDESPNKNTDIKKSKEMNFDFLIANSDTTSNYQTNLYLWRNRFPEIVLNATIDPLYKGKVAETINKSLVDQSFFYLNDGYYNFIIDDYNVKYEFLSESINEDYLDYGYVNIHDLENGYSTIEQVDVSYEKSTKQLKYFSYYYLSDTYYFSYSINENYKNYYDVIISLSLLSSMETYNIYTSHPELKDLVNFEKMDKEEYDRLLNKYNNIVDFVLKQEEIQSISYDFVSNRINYILNNYIEIEPYYEDGTLDNLFEGNSLQEYRDEFFANYKFDFEVQKFIVENGVLTSYVGTDEVLEIPEDVVKIDKNVELVAKEIVFPEGLETIEINENRNYPFANIFGNPKLTFKGENPHFTFEDGYLYNDDSIIYIYDPSLIKSIDLTKYSLDVLRVFSDLNNKYEHKEKSLFENVEEVTIPSSYFINDTFYELLPNVKKLIIDSENEVDIIIDNNTVKSSKINEILFLNNPNVINLNSYNYLTLSNINIPHNVISLSIGGLISLPNDFDINIYTQLTHIGALPIKDEIFEIPSNVKTINGNAFVNSNIKTLIIPETFETVVGEKLVGKIEEVIFTGKRDKIDDNFFSKLNTLNKVTLPDGLKEIGANAFALTSIKSFTIPDSVEKIGNNAFYYSKIEFIDLNNINIIPNECFFGCINLTEIKYKKIIEIQDRALAFTKLNEFCLSDEIIYDSSIFYNADIETLTIHTNQDIYDLYFEDAHISNIEIIGNYNEINVGNFMVTNLTINGKPKLFIDNYNIYRLILNDIISVAYDNYLKETNSYISLSKQNIVFKDPSSYYTITYLNDDGSVIDTEKVIEGTNYIISKTATSSNESTFESSYIFEGWLLDNKPIKEVLIIDNVTLKANYIINTLFSYEEVEGGIKILGYSDPSYNPESIIIPNIFLNREVVEIKKGAFENCNKVTYIQIPFVGRAKNTYSLNIDYIFSENADLSTILEVRITNSEVLSGLKNLTSLQSFSYDLPINEIYNHAFENNAIKEYEIPSSVTILHNSCFSRSNLEKVIFNETLTEIPFNAFEDAFNLKYVELKNVTKIQGQAFLNCYNLISIDTTKINIIRSNAFENCKKLTEIVINLDSSLKNETNILLGCENIEKLTTNCNDLFTLFGDTNVTKLKEVEIINNKASNIYDCIEKLTIYNGGSSYTNITNLSSSNSIKEFTFNGALSTLVDVNLFSKLEVLTIKASEDFQERLNFYRIFNKNLEVHIYGISQINTSITYYNNLNLKSISFYDLKSITGSMNNNDCQINIYSNIETLSSNVFKNSHNIYVESFEEMTSINSYTFSGTNAFESIVFSNKLTRIFNFAFENSTITNITIHGSTNVDSAAFTNSIITDINVIESDINNIYSDGTGVYSSSYTDFYTLIYICGEAIDYEIKQSIKKDENTYPVIYVNLELYNLNEVKSLIIPESIISFTLNSNGNLEGLTFLGENIQDIILPYDTQLNSLQIPTNLLDKVNAITKINKLTVTGSGRLNLKDAKEIHINGNFNSTENYYQLPSLNKLEISGQLTSELRIINNNPLTAIINTDVTSLKDITIKKVNVLYINTLNVSNQNYNFKSSNPYSLILSNNVFDISNLYARGFNNVNLHELTKLTEIGNKAFADSLLQHIELPDNITSIGSGAFYNSSISSISLNNVNTIGNDAFSNCRKLESIDLTNIISLGSGAFQECTNLNSVNMGALNIIDVNTFHSNSSLTSINLENIEIIEERAFAGCRNLNQVTLGNKLSKIGSFAFSNCSSLTNLQLPDSLKIIEAYAFQSSGLIELNIPRTVENIGNNLFSYCNSLLKLSIPITSDDNSFLNNLFDDTTKNNLQEITVYGNGSNFTQLSSFSGLITVTLYDFESIGSRVFRYCNNLHTVNLYNISTIESEVFKDKTNLTNVSLNGVTNIDSFAFKNCEGLTSITLPEELEFVGNSAFENCLSLKNIYIQSSIEFSGSVFKNCYSLENVYLVNGGKDLWESLTFNNIYSTPMSYASNLYDGSGINLNQGYYYFVRAGAYQFYNFDNITKFDSHDSFETTIGKYAFSSCDNLTEIVIGAGYKKIDTFAFSSNPSLKKLLISENVEQIGDDILRNTVNLDYLYIPFIGNTMDDTSPYLYNFFYSNCAVTIKELHLTKQELLNEKTFSNNENTLNIEKLSLYNIKRIEKDSFTKISNLTQLSISNTIKYAEENVFDSLNLNYNYYDYAKYLGNSDNPYALLIDTDEFKDANTGKLSIHNKVRCIMNNAFDNENIHSIDYEGDVNQWCNVILCGLNATPMRGNSFTFNDEQISNLVIDKVVTKINDYQFYGYSSVKSLSLPNTLESIGKYAFTFDGPSLEQPLNIPGNIKYIHTTSFSMSVLNLVDEARYASVNGVKNAILVKPENIYGESAIVNDQCYMIAAGAFNKHSFLKNINLRFIMNICDEAFVGCTNLKEIYFSTDLSYIGKDAFKDTNITDVYYTGTQEQWNEIIMENEYSNPSNNGATIHFNYVFS